MNSGKKASGKWMADTRLRFQLRRASLNSLGRRSLCEGGEGGHDGLGSIEKADSKERRSHA
jgi:hypothetical protein